MVLRLKHHETASILKRPIETDSDSKWLTEVLSFQQALQGGNWWVEWQAHVCLGMCEGPGQNYFVNECLLHSEIDVMYYDVKSFYDHDALSSKLLGFGHAS